MINRDILIRSQSPFDDKMFTDTELFHDSVFAPTLFKIKLVDVFADLDKLFFSITILAVKGTMN